MDYTVRNSNEILKQIQYLFNEYSKAKEYEDNQVREEINYIHDKIDNLTVNLNKVNNDIINQKEKNKMIAEILNKD
jgi:esterase/lipase